MLSDGIILLPLKKRLIFLQQETLNYVKSKEKRSEWMDKLLNHISDFFNETSIEAFAKKLFSKTIETDIAFLIQKTIHPRMDVTASVFKFLEDSLTNEYYKELKPFIRDAFYNNIAVAKLPGYEHHYSISDGFAKIIEDRTCYEIVHGFYRSSCNYQRISFHRDGINYPMELFLLENEVNKQKAFLLRLVHECYKRGWESLIPAKEQADLIYQFCLLGKERMQELFDIKRPDLHSLEQKINNEAVTFYLLQTLWLENRTKNIAAEAAIASYFSPIMKLFRLCTSSCWNIGHHFLEERFPLLFEFPLLATACRSVGGA